MRPVIVTTKHLAVVFGYTEDSSGETIKLKDSRWCIYWATTGHIAELATSGPNANSRLSHKADVELRDVTAVFEITAEAAKKFDEFPQ